MLLVVLTGVARASGGMAAVQEALAAEVHRFDGCGADPAELRVALDATGAVTAWTLGPTPSTGAQCVRTALADFAFPALGRPTELFLSYVPGVGVSALAGGLAPAEIAATIAAATDRFEACYERFVDAPVRGKLAVAFTIDARGRVSEAALASSTVDDPRVGPCFVARVAELRFPAPVGGGIVKATFPFTLGPR